MELKPGYKHTEVGVIPEDWEVLPLSELATVDPENLSSATDPNFLFNYISLEQVNYGRLLGASSEVFITAPSRARRIVRHDDILMSTVRPNLKAHLHFQSQVSNAICSTGFAVLRAKPEVSDPAYIFAHLFASPLNRQIDRILAGSNYPAVNSRDVGELKVPCPPTIAEQRAIAGALSDVDALLAAQEQLIAKKRDLKQAAMQQLLTGKTRLPGFSGAWEVKKLGEVASFFKGKGLPKSAIVPFGSAPCIHYGELFTKYPETIKDVISRTNDLRNAFLSVKNDVLMPTSDVTPNGLAKASCITLDGVILGGDILVIRPDNARICGSFLSYVIRREEEQVLQLVTGTTVYHLYGSDMERFSFSFPSLPEQTAIASVLSDMDAEISALEARREKTRAIKHAMMQELLTGKTRLIATA